MAFLLRGWSSNDVVDHGGCGHASFVTCHGNADQYVGWQMHDGSAHYLMPVLDGWTNVFASPGKRTTGTQAGDFAIVGPHWTGTLPAGMKEFRSPTNTAIIAGRTQANGSADYRVVNAIQKQYRLTPLSAYGKPYTPPAGVVDPQIDMTTAPVDQVNAMSADTFFSRLAGLMASNPPATADADAREARQNRHRARSLRQEHARSGRGEGA